MVLKNSAKVNFSFPNGKGELVTLPVDKKTNFMIDIDGCLCEHVDNEEVEKMVTVEPNTDARTKVNKWYDEGHYVCFFTSRLDAHKKVTETWLNIHGFKYHQIIFNKPRGGNYHYIDDKPIRATRFEGKFSEFVVKKKDIQVFD